MFFWPAVSLAFNFVSTLLTIIVNKYAFSAFPFPTTLTVLHYLVVYAALRMARAFLLFERVSLPRDHRLQFWALCFSWSLANGLSNASLSANSVGFYQLMKVLATPAVAAFDCCVYHKPTTCTKVLLLASTCVGVALATVNDVQLNTRGSLLAVVSVLLGVLCKVMSEHMQQRAGLTSLQLMDHCFVPMMLIGAVLALAMDDVAKIVSQAPSMNAVLRVGASAIVAICMNLSATLVLGTTSALALVLLGQLKTCSVLLAGVVLFDAAPKPVAILGAAGAVTSIGLYTGVKMHEKSVGVAKATRPPRSHAPGASTPESEQEPILEAVENGETRPRR